MPSVQVSPVRHRVTRRALLRAGLLAAAGAAAGCARPQPAAPASPSPGPAAPAGEGGAPRAAPSAAPAVARELDVVHQGGVGVSHTTEIARVRGYFRDVGIDLQDEPFASGAQQTPLLASGQLDAGTTSVQSAHFNAVSRGVALRLVVDKGHLEPGATTQSVVLRADLVPTGVPPPIAEIRGRPMAISTDPKQGGTGFAIARMLATVGLTLDDVDWKIMPNRDMADFIANRGVDGAVLLEPFYTLSAQRTPLLLWQRLADYYPGMQIGAFAFGERFVLERPDVARRWMIANLRGARDYYDWMRRGQPPDATGEILAESTGLPNAVVTQVSWEAVNPDGYLNVDGLLTDQQQLVEWGAIREVLPVERLVDHRFVEQALAQLGRYAG